jgi:hypothetical protein
MVTANSAQQIHEALGQLAGSRQPSPKEPGKPERSDAGQARNSLPAIEPEKPGRSATRR